VPSGGKRVKRSHPENKRREGAEKKKGRVKRKISGRNNEGGRFKSKEGGDLADIPVRESSCAANIGIFITKGRKNGGK